MGGGYRYWFAGVLWVVSPVAVSAQASLAWTAPAECPSADDARGALAALVGAAGVAAQARVEIERRGAKYHAQIAISGAISAQRALDGPRCASVSDAALLIIAVLVDPLTTAAHVSPPLAASTTRLELQLALGARGDLGSLPEATFGPALQLGLAYGRFRGAIEAGLWVPRAKLNGPRPETGGEYGLWDVGLRGSVAAVRSAGLDFGPSLAFALGRSSGEQVELRQPKPVQHQAWAAAFVGACLRHREERLFVELSVDLGLLVQQPEYEIDGVGTVFAPERWFGRLALTIGWSLS